MLVKEKESLRKNDRLLEIVCNGVKKVSTTPKNEEEDDFHYLLKRFFIFHPGIHPRQIDSKLETAVHVNFAFYRAEKTSAI